MVKAVTKGTGYPGTRVNGKRWNYQALIVGKRLLKDKLKKTAYLIHTTKACS